MELQSSKILEILESKLPSEQQRLLLYCYASGQDISSLTFSKTNGAFSLTTFKKYKKEILDSRPWAERDPAAWKAQLKHCEELIRLDIRDGAVEPHNGNLSDYNAFLEELKLVKNVDEFCKLWVKNRQMIADNVRNVDEDRQFESLIDKITRKRNYAVSHLCDGT